jgi:hypothetical protein
MNDATVMFDELAAVHEMLAVCDPDGALRRSSVPKSSPAPLGVVSSRV